MLICVLTQEGKWTDGRFVSPQGVAAKDFFMPGPALNLSLRKSLIHKASPPDILVHKLVTPDNVEKLFDM